MRRKRTANQKQQIFALNQWENRDIADIQYQDNLKVPTVKININWSELCRVTKTRFLSSSLSGKMVQFINFQQL